MFFHGTKIKISYERKDGKREWQRRTRKKRNQAAE